jgi:HK97 family phage major capsid protein
VGLIALATAPMAIPRKSRADLDKIIADAEKIEKDHEGKQMPPEIATKLNDLYREGEALSTEINEESKRQNSMVRMKRASEYLREVPEPLLPNVEGKSADPQIAGYITPGHLAVMSDAFQSFKSRGLKKGDGVHIDISGALLARTGQKALIALSEPEVKSLREIAGKLERKDLAVIGDLVIEPARVNRVVQDTRPDILTLRDVLTVSPTSSPLIQYVAEVSYTEGADIQSEGPTAATMALKSEADIEYEVRDATVRTIAVTLPVTEQQMSDMPALINRINNRLLWDLKKKEEQLCGYGSGSGTEFAGFFDSDSDVATATTTGGDTLIDKIRKAQTDVFTSGYLPSFAWIHPIDWETIELAKGSDGQYIWAIIRDNLGPRIWSMRVVQGVGTKKAGANTRNILVGDGNGAVLYDREQANIAIGWVDDQFARNMRTIRAEERVVLCIEAPAAFRKINTVA